MTERLYRDDPYRLDFEARVLARLEHLGRPAVVLDRTAFYAESGGQPWDTGSLNDVPVVAVVEKDDEILHVLGGPLPEDSPTPGTVGPPVRGRVDAARRRDHRQQHHGQHLLSRAFVEQASACTVSFHLGADESSVDLDREVDDDAVRSAEARANEVIWEGRPVTVRTVSRAEARALGIEAPEEAGDAIRLVDAEGFDVQPCGGTHPRKTSEVGVVLVVGRDRYKGGSRVRFVCGHRALETSRRHVTLLDRLGTVLSAAHEALPDTAERLVGQAAAADRRSRELLERALTGEARRLIAAAPTAPALVVASYDGWPAADLRALATILVGLGPGVAILGSRADGKAHVVFAQSPGLPHDVPALLSEAVALLGGRGGGRGNVAQGGGERVDLLDDALVRAAEAVRARS